MSVSSRLVFDPASASDSSNVGSWVRAGTDGTKIGSQNINSLDWLNTTAALFDGSGVAITSTLLSGKQCLDVNIASPISVAVDLNGIYNVSTNPSPDNVGQILFNRAASPALSDQVFTPTGGIANADAIVAANVHAADVAAFGYGYNGTTWDRLQVDASKFLKVSVQNSITTSDAALANTAITNGATSVGVTAVSTVSSALSNRKYLFYMNNASHAVYLGTTGVTTANGFPVYPGGAVELRAGAAIDVKAISGSAAQDTRYLELS